MSQHNAGRQVDALIAATVMGWTDFVPHEVAEFDVTATPPEWNGSRYQRVPDYSTRVAAMWLVWERLTNAGLHVVLRSRSAVTGRPRVEITGVHPKHRTEWLVTAEEATMPLALCVAALAAVEVQPLSPQTPPHTEGE